MWKTLSTAEKRKIDESDKLVLEELVALHSADIDVLDARLKASGCYVLRSEIVCLWEAWSDFAAQSDWMPLPKTEAHWEYVLERMKRVVEETPSYGGSRIVLVR